MSGRWTTSTRARRLPPNWNTIRTRVLVRDHHTCRINSPNCIGTANEVDHRIPNDDHSMMNLQAACTPCHKQKTQLEAQAARPSRKRDTESHPGQIRT